MSEKIGVYVCECGPNIKDALKFEEVVQYAGKLENVAFAKPVRLLCSGEGKELIARDIKEQKLTRVVVAACSPREHEATFKKVLQDAGMNPYYLQIANIREHCAWVMKDKDQASEHAKKMIKAAVKRVVLHQALVPREIDCLPDALVVGSGIAGMSAALTLAQEHRTVYLVEKLPCIGGTFNRYGEAFPRMECAPCMLEHKLDEILHDEHIELFAYSEVKEVTGFLGNFNVKINKKARFVNKDACLGCGACAEACPVKVKNELNEGLNQRSAIYMPYPGALPNLAVLDQANCLRFQGKECSACQAACPFGAINYDDKDEVVEVKVGAMVLATGFDVFDARKAPQYGYGAIDDVYNNLEMERLLSTTGPTQGKVLRKNGQAPKKIALINCVGSRSEKFLSYCSGVCCQENIKFMELIKHQLHDAHLVNIYSDFCLTGKDGQKFFNKVSKEHGVEFIRTANHEAVEVFKKNGSIAVKFPDAKGAQAEIDGFDMVILGTGIQGVKNAAELAQMFDVSIDKSNFFVEEHGKLAPVSTTTEGVFVIGCCVAPVEMGQAAEQGQAAAGKILFRLVPGQKLVLDPRVSEIIEDNCSGCKSCIGLCPYRAITFDESKKRAKINDILCRGCGVCVAACPSGAIVGKHFTDEQIFEEIKAVLR